jgi:hypothetical protein
MIWKETVKFFPVKFLISFNNIYQVEGMVMKKQVINLSSFRDPNKTYIA